MYSWNKNFLENISLDEGLREPPSLIFFGGDDLIISRWSGVKKTLLYLSLKIILKLINIGRCDQDLQVSIDQC